MGGSATTMMAKDVVKGYYNMRFFSPCIPTLFLVAVTSVACAVLAPTLLHSSLRVDRKLSFKTERKPYSTYDVAFKVQPGGRYDGVSIGSVASMLGNKSGVYSITGDASSGEVLRGHDRVKCSLDAA